MRAVVFVNGILRNLDRWRAWLRADDYLVAADGGARHCLALGRNPHALVGDLDSVTPQLVAQLTAQGVKVERYPAEKNMTDLELALEHALAAGASEIVLLGALGGRLDQALANVLILAQRDWPVPVRVLEAEESALVMHGGETITLDAAVGHTVSLIPLSEEVTGITYTGLRYPLTDATLRLGSTRGISNEVAATPATVHIATDIALIVQTMPDLTRDGAAHEGADAS